MDDDMAAQRIAGNIIGRQKRLAEYLNHKTGNLSQKFWLLALIFFCAAFGSYCLYLLGRAIN